MNCKYFSRQSAAQAALCSFVSRQKALRRSYESLMAFLASSGALTSALLSEGPSAKAAAHWKAFA